MPDDRRRAGRRVFAPWTVEEYRGISHIVRDANRFAIAYALALGRLDTVSYQSVKWLSAKRAPISIATSAVMSAIVKRSPATKCCPFSSRSVRDADKPPLAELSPCRHHWHSGYPNASDSHTATAAAAVRRTYIAVNQCLFLASAALNRLIAEPTKCKLTLGLRKQSTLRDR